MKLKIMLIVLLCFSVGIAQQKDKKVKADKGKWEELKEYPKPISPIQPEYPQVAKLAGIQGKVYVEAMISESGDVIQTKILKSEHETLEGAALEAVKKTKFSPGISKEGKKVKASVVIPMAFKLDDKDKETIDLSSGQKQQNSEVIDLDPDVNAFTEVEKLPELVESVKPEYPEIAKRAGITGKVFVKALVDKEGTVKKAIVIKSDSELFNQSAIDATKKSKFTPAIQDGKPVAVWIVLPYKFALDDKEPKQNHQTFKTEDEAKKEFETIAYYLKNPKELKKIGSMPEQKTEIVKTDFSYGDESIVVKNNTKEIENVFMLIARKGNTVYRYPAKSIDELRKTVIEKKASDQK